MNTDHVELQIETVKAILPWPSHPLRHPIRWWKTRHLRAAMRRPLPAVEAKLAADLEHAFLVGDGDAA